MGYGADQVKDLEATINQVDCDTVVIGTPIDLRRVLKLNKPSTRVRYNLVEITTPDLREVRTRLEQTAAGEADGKGSDNGDRAHRVHPASVG